LTDKADHHFDNLAGGLMERIQAALMKWGEAMQLRMENRTLFYSPVLKHWRVKKWVGKKARSFLYDGDDFNTAFEHFLGPRADGESST
jgi:hypothetical protein